MVRFLVFFYTVLQTRTDVLWWVVSIKMGILNLPGVEKKNGVEQEVTKVNSVIS